MSKGNIDGLMLELEKDPQYAEWAESYDAETIEDMRYRVEESGEMEVSYSMCQSDWTEYWALNNPPVTLSEEDLLFFERYCY